MKIKYLIVLIVVLIFSVGCNNPEDDLFKNGQEALENHDYDLAEEYLSDVLQEDPKNESARSMYLQSIKMYEAEKYKTKGLYSKGIESLERIVNIDNGSRKIKVEANELKKELENLKYEEEAAANIRKANAKEIAKRDMQKAERDFYIWQKNQEQDSLEQNDDEGLLNETFLDNVKDKLLELLNQ